MKRHPAVRRSWLTPQVKAWLAENYAGRPVEETARLVHELFGFRVTVGQVRAANKNHRFGFADRGAALRLYTDEQIDWLREHLPAAPRAEVCIAFKERFGRRVTASALDNICTKYGFQGAPNTGRFRKGSVPANKGRKGHAAPGSEKGWFKEGSVPANLRPLWSERWAKNNGGPILEIKVPGPAPWPSHHSRGLNRKTHWVRKAVWVWTQEHGPVPDGHVVIQLDGDPANCDLANLDCVSRKVLQRLNHPTAPPWAGPEANPARVRLAQLRTAVAERTDG